MLSGPSSGLASPSLIRDSDSKQTWDMSSSMLHMSTSMHHACSCGVKDVLSNPSSGLAGPSLIRDSDSKQIWDMSSSMHYAYSCVTGCMEAQQSEGCVVRSPGPSSGLAGPSLIRDSDSKQTWHVSSSLHHTCSCGVKDILSNPSSGLAGPSLIRDSDSKQIWDMSSSMHYAYSCAAGCMKAQQSEGCAVRSFLWSSLIRDSDSK